MRADAERRYWGRGKYVTGKEIHEINQKFRDLEAERDKMRAERDALRQAVETCDQKMSRLGDDEWVMLYQVKAGWWHKVLAIARA